MNLHDTWRDRQINGFENLTADTVLLEQEQVMLNFVTQFDQVCWRWVAPKTQFFQICQQHIQITDCDSNGIVVFGPALSDIDTATLVDRIQKFTDDVDYAYIAINRYSITRNTLNIDLPDSIEQTIDSIVALANPRFSRLASFENVDGNHMVFSHPMDCFGLCK